MSAALDISSYERRERQDRSFNEHYDNLTADQVERVYSMSKVGYSLYFVRDLGNGKRLAILQQGIQLASVDYLGEMDFNPDVQLRD